MPPHQIKSDKIVETFMETFEIDPGFVIQQANSPSFISPFKVFLSGQLP